MKYIENLLKGQKVEWKTLGELGEFYGGLTGKNKNDFSEGNAKYVTYVNVFKNPALNFDINDFVKINKSENQNKIQYGDILFTGSSETPDECGMSSVVNKKVEEDIYLNSFCFGFRLNEPSEFDPDFLKHIFRSFELRKQIGLTANGVTRFNVSKKRMEKVKIPLPPLTIQQEIANILDTFTTLEAELEAELDCRKRQYHHYRDTLLTFGDNVEWKTLGEVFDLKNGYTPSKSNKEYWENGTIPWFRMEDIRANGRVLNDSLQKVSPSAVKGGKLFPANSIILATSATIGEHALVKVPYLSNQRFTNFSLKKEFLSQIDVNFYFYYFFKINDWCKENIKIGNFPSVDTQRLSKIQIPLPPLEEQKRIVNILDKFDTLTNSITEGLPKEIELRRKQYEYYREKLLLFPEN